MTSILNKWITVSTDRFILCFSICFVFVKMISMFAFTLRQQRRALCWLAFFHISVITASNYLVQIPFTILGCHTTWGAFTFPFIFLTTDLTVRIFGASLARHIIFFVMIPALIISYVVSVLFFDGAWQGLSNLQQVNSFVFRIALASFTAYAVGQLLDILVFNRLRQIKQWWIAPSASAIAGNALDTVVFFFVAFYRSSDAFMAEHWVDIACLDYAAKIIICAFFFLPAYGVLLNIMMKKLLAVH